MVWVEGKSAPTKKYWDYKEAEMEAERLATKEMKPAYVMMALSGMSPSIVCNSTVLFNDAPEGYTEPCSE